MHLFKHISLSSFFRIFKKCRWLCLGFLSFICVACHPPIEPPPRILNLDYQTQYAPFDTVNIRFDVEAVSGISEIKVTNLYDASFSLMPLDKEFTHRQAVDFRQATNTGMVGTFLAYEIFVKDSKGFQRVDTVYKEVEDENIQFKILHQGKHLSELKRGETYHLDIYASSNIAIAELGIFKNTQRRFFDDILLFEVKIHEVSPFEYQTSIEINITEDAESYNFNLYTLSDRFAMNRIPVVDR
ncbi:MAG: hypothetical protein LAT68_02410 [Cyclobacteriaceae bacterium]|nr:hypothetical protein [Cyclobacteriaceae bacterium]MCH8515157.1 hypothetical protein [Cyclobacteriaceae bacterium]